MFANARRAATERVVAVQALDARRSVVLDQDLDRLPDVAAALRRALGRGTLAQRAVLLLRGRRLVHAEVGLHCLFVLSCVSCRCSVDAV